MPVADGMHPQPGGGWHASPTGPGIKKPTEYLTFYSFKQDGWPHIDLKSTEVKERWFSLDVVVSLGASVHVEVN